MSAKLFRNSYISGLLLLLLFTSVTGAISWHQGAYQTGEWQQGQAPLGFGSDTVRTVLPSGRSEYYFRNLFFVPDTADPDTGITALRLTVLTDESVTVHFNGSEVGRSGQSREEATEIYAYAGARQIPARAFQEFDLSSILFDCYNSLGQNWRPIAIELHRNNVYEPLVFDAFVSAQIQGSWEHIVPENAFWKWYPGTDEPPAMKEFPVSGVLYPLTGMPVLTAPGRTFQVTVEPDIDTANSIFILAGSRNTFMLTDLVSDQLSGRGRDMVFKVPDGHVPGTFCLYVFGPSESGTADDQSVRFSARSVGILPAIDTSLSVIHISDSHLPYRGFYYPDTGSPLLRIMDALSSLQPDLVIHTGDGYNEGNFRDQAALFHRFLQEFEVPVAYVGGNHELGEWCGSGSSREHYWDFFGWPKLDPRRTDHWITHTRDFIVDAGPVSFVCVETWTSYTPFWNAWYPWRSLTYSQIGWMRDAAANRPDQFLVACYHYDFNSTLETEVMPMFNYNMGLSGHTHTPAEYSVGPITFYTVGSTYQASRPLRWFHFRDGLPQGGNLLMPNPVEIHMVPAEDVSAISRTISVRNHEFSDIPGLRTWIPMLSGVEYAVTSSANVTLLGQWTGHGTDWICVEQDLDARTLNHFTVHPEEPAAAPDIFLAFTIDHALFRADTHYMLSARLVNTGPGKLVDVHIALEADGQYFFWPGWSKTPSAQTMYSGTHQTFEFPVLELTWPNLPVLGETVTFLGVVLDSKTGKLLSPPAEIKQIY